MTTGAGCVNVQRLAGVTAGDAKIVFSKTGIIPFGETINAQCIAADPLLGTTFGLYYNLLPIPPIPPFVIQNADNLPGLGEQILLTCQPDGNYFAEACQFVGLACVPFPVVGGPTVVGQNLLGIPQLACVGL